MSDASFIPYLSLLICATKLPSVAYSYSVQKEPQTINGHRNKNSTKYCQHDYCTALLFFLSFFFFCIILGSDYELIEMCDFLPSGTKFCYYFISPYFSSLISEYFVYSPDVGFLVAAQQSAMVRKMKWTKFWRISTSVWTTLSPSARWTVGNTRVLKKSERFCTFGRCTAVITAS